jgi:hypothetical protein
VSYYKGSPNVIVKFIEVIHEEYSRHAHVRMSSIAKIAELQEENLHLSIMHKEIIK